jgi:toxin ParE1/3/4
VSEQRWTVRLSAAAETDFLEILRWTTAQFGKTQAQAYADTVSSALRELASGPTSPGAKARPELGEGISTLHVARKGKKGRHFVVFKTGQSKKLIDVLRLLHDSMDLQRHLPATNDTADDGAD